MSNKARAMKLRQQAALIPSYILLIMWCVFIFVMLGWIVMASFSTTRELFTDKLLSSGLHWENYGKVVVTGRMYMAFLNSLLYSSVSVFFTILVCAPAAYGLSRFDFRLKNMLIRLLVIGLGIPGVMVIIPLFSIITMLHMGDSKLTLITLYTVTSIPFCTFFLLPAFSDISPTYEEAAAIDGCGPVRAFWTIVFPLARPSVTTLVIFQFIGKWNEYFMAQIFANSGNNRSMSVSLNQIIVAMTREGGWGGMFAAVTFVSFPTIVLYVILSRKIIGGTTAGGIKG